jgi:hypothetical protein
VEVAADANFTKPVFTATVVHDPAPQKLASVVVTPPLDFGRIYTWRVTARNDFGTVVSAPRHFRVD